MISCLVLNAKAFGIGNLADRKKLNNLIVKVFEYEDSLSQLSVGLLQRVGSGQNSPLFCGGIGYERFFNNFFGMGISSLHCGRSIKRSNSISRYKNGMQNINFFDLDFILSFNLRNIGIDGPFSGRSFEIGLFLGGSTLLSVINSSASKRFLITPGVGGKAGVFFDIGPDRFGLRSELTFRISHLFISDSNYRKDEFSFFDKKDAGFINLGIAFSIAGRYSF